MLENRRIGVWFPAGVRDVCFLLKVQIGSVTHTSSYLKGTRNDFPGVKAVGASNWTLTSMWGLVSHRKELCLHFPLCFRSMHRISFNFTRENYQRECGWSSSDIPVLFPGFWTIRDSGWQGTLGKSGTSGTLGALGTFPDGDNGDSGGVSADVPSSPLFPTIPSNLFWLSNSRCCCICNRFLIRKILGILTVHCLTAG